MWSPSGLYVDYVEFMWSSCGVQVNSMWTLSGLYVDYVDSMWTLCGLYVECGSV